MKRSDFILPLLLSAVIHLGIFIAGDPSDADKTPVQEEVSSITLKLISSVARNTPRPSFAFDKPVRPAPQETLQPAPKVSEPEKKPEPKKVVKLEPPKNVPQKPPVKRVKESQPRLKPERMVIQSKTVPQPSAAGVPSPQPLPNASQPVPEKPALVSRLEAQSGPIAESKEKEALVAARIVGLVKPQYPRYCRRRNQEGTVIIAVAINRQGEQTDVKIVRSSGYLRLDKAAMKALQKARFLPARKGGKAVPATKRVAFTFRLEDAEE
ncbi:MAG: energy transducer TonB [Deltaproteobacteria bacterium]|nr:energy transducer TonB [Deltaproteobacteria bacterium]